MTSSAKPSFDPLYEILNAPFTRRGMLRTAMAAGAAAPAFRVAGAFAKQDGGEPGGTATVLVAANPASWDLTTTTWPTWQSVQFMYDRLLAFDAEENLIPQLVTEWALSEDGLEYTLTLRQGVTFHDGTPFNAESVRFNIQRYLDQPDSSYYTIYETVERVDIVDDLTAKIVLKNVRPNFAYEGLAQWGAVQLSPTAVQELGEGFAEAPVGTGPFKFDVYEPGSSIRFARNDEYWDGAPLLDAVEIKVIPEPSVQLIEMEAGTADAALIQPKDVQAMTDLEMTIEQSITPGANFISLNVSQAPTDELAVRRAIARSIDREAMIEALLFGTAELARAGVNSASPFYDDTVPMVEYNPDEAGTILDEAGWVMGSDGVREREGQKLTLSLLSTDFSEWGLFNQAIQEQLAAVGIASEISSLEWNAYLDQWRENQGGWNATFHSQGSIMAAVSPIQASWYPDAYWTISQIDDATNPELGPIRDELQGLQDEFEVTLDEARRKEIATRAQTIFQEQQLTVWLWHAATIYAIQPRLQGYTLSHAGRVLELSKASVAE